MKTFKEILDELKKRKRHWQWEEEDLEKVVPPPEDKKVEEKQLGSWDNPAPDKIPFYSQDDLERQRHIDHGNQQAKSFGGHHKMAISLYKSDSTHHYNDHLRKNKTIPENTAYRFKHLDYVTGHPNPNHLVGYRSVSHHLFNNMMPGSTFTDHGYTGLSFNKHTPDDYAYAHPVSQKPVIAKVHVPAGTRGHYIDAPAHNHGLYSEEKEYLLHRGTTYKVLGHTESKEHHIVHMSVVGQEHHHAESKDYDDFFKH